MYCKECGCRSGEQTDTCPQCGAKLKAALDVGSPSKRPRVRWQAIVLTAVAAVILFGVLPRYLFRSEFEMIGPTDKVRFLRALAHSEYRRSGQQEFHMDGETLVVVWDLRWETLAEAKQTQIVRIIGRAWHVVGGETTEFLIEGGATPVARYKEGEAVLQGSLIETRKTP